MIGLEFSSQTLKENNQKKKISIHNVYASWTKDDPKPEIVYNILNQELKTNTNAKFICGDFNATIEDSHEVYPQNVGFHEKNKTNFNGEILGNFLCFEHFL